MGGRAYESGIAERIEPTVAAVRERLRAKGAAVWATGVGIALLTWPVGFLSPAPGLDLSWISGLYMAVHDGKRFGSEIVFSYGPLGFLAWPELWFSWLAVFAYVYSAAIYLAFSVTLTWRLNRTVGLVGAGVVAFLYLAVLQNLEEVPLMLAVGLAFAALRADRPPATTTVLAVGGGLLSAIEPLVKLSVGPPIVLICVLGLAGARAGRRQWLLFAAIALGGLVSLWLISGQVLGDLWDYGVNSAQIISGYGEAMDFEGAKTSHGVLLVTFTLGLVAAVSRGDFRDSRARWFATALTAVLAYVLFKYGITRFHPGPISLALGAMLGVFLMIPWPRRRAAAFLTASAVVGAIFLNEAPIPPRLDVVDNLNAFQDSAELAIRPGLRQGRINEARVNLQNALALPPEVLAAVDGKRVAIDPWEISVAWAYELDWSPLPVIQSYSAYTPRLDRLDAAAIEDPNGPQAILRANLGGTEPLGGNRSFGERQPAWDPPEQGFATVCNFRPTLTTATWQVLSRVPDRCGSPKPIASVSASPGEAVEVPQAGRNQLVILRLKGIRVEGLEELRLLFWRPPRRFAVLNGGLAAYRLVPGTGEDGLIVSRDPALDSTGAFSQLPEVKTMAVEGVNRQLQFDFYRVEVEPEPRLSR